MVVERFDSAPSSLSKPRPMQYVISVFHNGVFLFNTGESIVYRRDAFSVSSVLKHKFTEEEGYEVRIEIYDTTIHPVVIALNEETGEFQNIFPNDKP